MTATFELVMPKLGLTMTEGRIARWAVAAGQRFAAGDCLVEVETDKIVNEVAAPADGTMLAHLVAAGEVAAVATPIARWQGEAAATPATAATAAIAATTPAATTVSTTATAAATSAVPSAVPPAGRVVATPYARRLARDAGLSLVGIAGSGPGGRIKAADIARPRGETAPSKGPPTALVAVPSVPLQPRPAPAVALAATPRHASAIVDFDAARLVEISARLAAGPAARRIEHRQWLAIAVLRALERAQPRQGSFTLGLAGDDGVVALAVAAGTSGPALLGRLATGSSAHGGDILLDDRTGSARVLVPAPVAGWAAVLTIAAPRTAPRQADDGGIAWGHDASLALTFDEAQLPRAGATGLLDDVRLALEDPLHLLAS